MSSFNLPLQNFAERAPDPNEAIRRNNDALAAKIRVAIPAQVISFNAAQQTVSAQPLIREKVVNRQNGNIEWKALPVCGDVPVVFPQAGNFVLTMPIQAGDEVLLVFSDLNIDSWWFSGGVQNWDDRRRHDLSDAIAIPGINSIPNVIPNISSTAAELRTKDGTTKVVVSDAQLELVAPVVTVTTSVLNLNADDINATGAFRINGILFENHRHSGVDTGPNNTGGVVT